MIVMYSLEGLVLKVKYYDIALPVNLNYKPNETSLLFNYPNAREPQYSANDAGVIVCGIPSLVNPGTTYRSIVANRGARNTVSDTTLCPADFDGGRHRGVLLRSRRRRSQLHRPTVRPARIQHPDPGPGFRERPNRFHSGRRNPQSHHKDAPRVSERRERLSGRSNTLASINPNDIKSKCSRTPHRRQFTVRRAPTA